MRQESNVILQVNTYSEYLSNGPIHQVSFYAEYGGDAIFEITDLLDRPLSLEDQLDALVGQPIFLNSASLADYRFGLDEATPIQNSQWLKLVSKTGTYKQQFQLIKVAEDHTYWCSTCFHLVFAYMDSLIYSVDINYNFDYTDYTISVGDLVYVYQIHYGSNQIFQIINADQHLAFLSNPYSLGMRATTSDTKMTVFSATDASQQFSIQPIKAQQFYYTPDFYWYQKIKLYVMAQI